MSHNSTMSNITYNDALTAKNELVEFLESNDIRGGVGLKPTSPNQWGVVVTLAKSISQDMEEKIKVAPKKEGLSVDIHTTGTAIAY